MKTFEDQKKELLRQLKEQTGETRITVRADLVPFGNVGAAVKQEVKETIDSAKQVSREHGRKLAEEAKEAAKEDRNRR